MFELKNFRKWKEKGSGNVRILAVGLIYIQGTWNPCFSVYGRIRRILCFLRCGLGNLKYRWRYWKKWCCFRSGNFVLWENSIWDKEVGNGSVLYLEVKKAIFTKTLSKLHYILHKFLLTQFSLYFHKLLLILTHSKSFPTHNLKRVFL